MADYAEVTDDETNTAAFMRQALGKKFKNNFINHQDRINAIESGAVFFDHFTSRWHDVDNTFALADHSWHPGYMYGDPLEAEKRDGRGPTWFFASDQADAAGSRNAVPTESSVARVAMAGGSAPWVTVRPWFTLRYDQIVKPMRCVMRCKMSADGRFKLGITSVTAGISKLADQTGVWLERVDASNWRFKARDTGASSVTGPFTRVASGTWFEIAIEFTDDPSDRAICKLDGVDKTAGGLTTNLPLDKDLALTVGLFGDATAPAVNYDFDRVRHSSGGIIDAP